MATTDEINDALQQQLASLPAGLNLSVVGSLASMPQLPSPNVLPLPNLFEQLQELRTTIQPVAPPPQTVEGKRNLHWRGVADYDKWAFPLFLYLENVDWQRVTTQHEAKWQRDFLNGLLYHKREYKGRYEGRRIKRDHVLPGTTYRVKLKLPIPTPAELAKRRFDEGRNLYLEVLRLRATQEQEAATDTRRLVAEQLKWAAISLGRYERNSWGNVSEWQPGWELSQAIEPEANRYRGVLQPAELGKVITLVENFWQCWRAFHEAEKQNAVSIYSAATDHIPHPPTQAMPAKLIITPAQHKTIHNILNRMLNGINGNPNILFLQEGSEELGISAEEGKFLREAMQIEGLITNSDGPGKNHLSTLTAVGISIARSPGGYQAYLQQQKQRYEHPSPTREDTTPIALSTLHPTIQQAAGSRFASGHYSDAIQKACTALEKAVQAKAGQPASITGASLMTTVFSQKNPLIHLADDANERFGFMSLYQGAVMALRNHYAHNLTELTDPDRALEWLGFISALFYKLDDA